MTSMIGEAEGLKADTRGRGRVPAERGGGAVDECEESGLLSSCIRSTTISSSFGTNSPLNNSGQGTVLNRVHPPNMTFLSFKPENGSGSGRSDAIRLPRR